MCLFAFLSMDFGAFQIFIYIDPLYTANMSHVAHFLPKQSQISVSSYGGILDRLAMEDVIFSSYGDHRQVQPFEDIF